MIPYDTQGHNNISNIYAEVTKYLNSPISVVNLAHVNIGNRRKGFANASDYLETWDDSDSITAIIAQKDLRQSQKWWHNHSEAQYQGSEINN